MTLRILGTYQDRAVSFRVNLFQNNTILCFLIPHRWMVLTATEKLILEFGTIESSNGKIKQDFQG